MDTSDPTTRWPGDTIDLIDEVRRCEDGPVGATSETPAPKRTGWRSGFEWLVLLAAGALFVHTRSLTAVTPAELVGNVGFFSFALLFLFVTSAFIRARPSLLTFMLFVGAVGGEVGLAVARPDPLTGAVTLGDGERAVFSNDGSRVLVVGELSDRPRVFAAATGEELVAFETPSDLRLRPRMLFGSPNETTVAFSPTLPVAIIATQDGIGAWETTGGIFLGVLDDTTLDDSGSVPPGQRVSHPPTPATFDREGRLLIHDARDRETRSVDPTSGRVRQRWSLPGERPLWDATAEHGIIIERLDDGTVMLADGRTSHVVESPNQDPRTGWKCDASVARGGRFVVLSHEETLVLVDLETPRVHPPVTTVDSDAGRLVASDGSLVIGEDGGDLFVHELPSGRLLARVDLRERVELLDVSPDASTLAVGVGGRPTILAIDAILTAGRPPLRTPLVWFQSVLVAAFLVALYAGAVRAPTILTGRALLGLGRGLAKILFVAPRDVAIWLAGVGVRRLLFGPEQARS